MYGKADTNQYVLARSLNGEKEKNIGILYLLIKDNMVTKPFEQLTSEISTRYLVDGEGKVLYSSDEELFGEMLDAQCSVAIVFYLFRALEKCGLYRETEKLWKLWKEMIRNHMTTCAEDGLKSRSDCHGWGALALYELPSVILGVRPAEPGYKKVEIKPHADYISWAEGEVVTPLGMLHVSWKKLDDGLNLEVTVPEGMEKIVRI